MLLAMLLAAAPAPVLWLEVRNDAPLFRDETAQVVEAVSRSLEATGRFKVIIPEEEKAGRALAARGRLVAKGPICAAAPSEAETLNAAFPGLLVGTLTLSCTQDGCSLSASVSDQRYRVHTFSPGKVVVQQWAHVADPTQVASWKQALAPEPAAWAPELPAGGGTSIGLGMMGIGGIAVSLSRLQGFQLERQPTISDFTPQELARVAKCGGKGSAPVVLGIDAKGGVTRCEAPLPCQCAELTKHRFPAAKGTGRVVLQLEHGSALAFPGGSPFSEQGRVAVVQGGVTYDEPGERGRARGTALLKCFAKGRDGLTFEVRSALDETGRPQSAKVTGNALGPEERACVEKTALGFTYRCPDAPGDEVWGKFSVLAL